MPAKKTPETAFPTNLLEASRYFADLDRATEFVAKLRWPDGPTCPNCEGKDHYYLATRRVWKCKSCKKQFSVKKGSIFEDSPIPLDKWLLAIWELANDRNGISSHELGRKIGVTQKSAWFMNHRIRLAMQQGSFEKWSEKFDGVTEVDETFIGGKARNMHRDRYERAKAEGSHFGKVPVMGILERDGEVRAKVIPPGMMSSHTMQSNVRNAVKPGTTVMSDEFMSYRGLGEQGYDHRVIKHAEKYVEGQVHINGMENFWSLLKRSLGGTYVSVRPFHLFRYLDEQTFRYNNREHADFQRVMGVLGEVDGKRVTYKQLTAKEEAEPPKPPYQRPPNSSVMWINRPRPKP